MAEKARTVPGARGRGPKPKLEHPMQTLGRVLGFVGKKYWLHLIVVVIAIVVSVLSMVQGTLFTKTLIDSYILPLVKTVQAGGTADFSGLIHAITRVALFYACGVLASLLQARVMIYVTQGALRDLRNEMFQHMQTLPIRYFDTHAHGDIMSIYTNDIDTLRQMISQSMPQLLNCTITVVSVLVSMIVLSIPLTLLTLAMVAVVLFTTKKFSGLSGRYFVAQQKNLGSLNGFIEEMMVARRWSRSSATRRKTWRSSPGATRPSSRAPRTPTPSPACSCLSPPNWATSATSSAPFWAVSWPWAEWVASPWAAWPAS